MLTNYVVNYRKSESAANLAAEVKKWNKKEEEMISSLRSKNVIEARKAKNDFYDEKNKWVLSIIDKLVGNPFIKGRYQDGNSDTGRTIYWDKIIVTVNMEVKLTVMPAVLDVESLLKLITSDFIRVYEITRLSQEFRNESCYKLLQRKRAEVICERAYTIDEYGVGSFETILPEFIPAESFKAYDELTEFIIPNTTKLIEGNAFAECDNLEKVLYKGVNILPQLSDKPLSLNF